MVINHAEFRLSPRHRKNKESKDWAAIILPGNINHDEIPDNGFTLIRIFIDEYKNYLVPYIKINKKMRD